MGTVPRHGEALGCPLSSHHRCVVVGCWAVLCRGTLVLIFVIVVYFVGLSELV